MPTARLTLCQRRGVEPIEIPSPVLTQRESYDVALEEWAEPGNISFLPPYSNQELREILVTEPRRQTGSLAWLLAKFTFWFLLGYAVIFMCLCLSGGAQ